MAESQSYKPAGFDEWYNKHSFQSAVTEACEKGLKLENFVNVYEKLFNEDPLLQKMRPQPDDIERIVGMWKEGKGMSSDYLAYVFALFIYIELVDEGLAP